VEKKRVIAKSQGRGGPFPGRKKGEKKMQNNSKKRGFYPKEKGGPCASERTARSSHAKGGKKNTPAQR